MGMKAIGQITAITLGMRKKNPHKIQEGILQKHKVNIPHSHPMNTGPNSKKTTNWCLDVHLADNGKQGFGSLGRNRIEVIFPSKEVISMRKPTGEEARSISR